MSFNAPLLLETALLMLAAFLAGAVIGLVLRLLLAKPKQATAAVVAETLPAAPAPSPTEDLVKAPAIARLPAEVPTAAQRLAAAGKTATPADTPQMQAIKMPELTLPVMPAITRIEPSHVAGETVTGRHIDNPEHPHEASLEDVRAELATQIDIAPIAPASETVVPPQSGGDAEIVPAELAAPEPALPDTDDALQAEEAAPMLAEISEAEAETRLPVEERVEPEIEAAPVVLTDAPAELAVEIQDVIDFPVGEPAPDVVAEAPLVEPVFEKQEAEADRTEPAGGTATAPQEDEQAAMRAIEGGWTPRRTPSTRKPADLPEGVSAAEVAAADRAVANSGAAVANAAAMASAVLEEIAPAKPSRAPGGFGRPAALAAPRDGGKDDFGAIKGLGPAIESSLNGLGVYHYDQIADWDQKAVVWVENHFGFKGRITRERWQDQARDLVRRRGSAARPVRR